MDASKQSRYRLVDNISESTVSKHAQSTRFHKLSASDHWRLEAHIPIRGITIRTGDHFTDSNRKSFFSKIRILGEAFDGLSARMSISLMQYLYADQSSKFSS